MLNRLQDVFKSFQQHEVRYIVVGGVASVLHGIPRATFDLDILIDPTEDNALRLLSALVDARFGTATMTNAKEILAHEITVFNDRVRIDVQTRTPGVSFQDAWRRRKTVTYHGQDFFILSKEDLISSKRASGRQVDLEDVHMLELPDQEETTS